MYFYAAIQWSRRRDDLDRQEAELLSHVKNLRRKVVSQMSISRDSGGSPAVANGRKVNS